MWIGPLAAGRAVRCSSFSRAGGTSAGAPIIRSSPCWLSGNRMTSRMFGSSASSMTMRSMPGRRAAMRRGAVAERVQHAAEALLHLLGRVAGDLEGADHDVRAMVADRARATAPRRCTRCRYWNALMVSGSCAFSASSPPCGMLNGLWLKSTLSGFLVQLEHREVGDPAEAERALLAETELLGQSRAHRAGEFRRGLRPCRRRRTPRRRR